MNGDSKINGRKNEAIYKLSKWQSFNKISMEVKDTNQALQGFTDSVITKFTERIPVNVM